ncbi:hypothetical protein C4B68_32600 [Streptomyces dengpaensis]|uniref:Uncharacterized protein n=1 Tax=Streptomyces dengpaensis TaxID=2049881 RepID=A0ABM6SYC8_9ACTN|nr:hypothetical protein C4B68_32600 [Streptomyces dengpaensis]PIB09354.1 hypothetical protein B1C81_09280 [Streptomyces sp. HG99]
MRLRRSERVQSRSRRSRRGCLHWYFQWFTVLFLGVTLVAGAAYRAYRARAGVAEEVVPASYA